MRNRDAPVNLAGRRPGAAIASERTGLATDRPDIIASQVTASKWVRAREKDGQDSIATACGIFGRRDNQRQIDGIAGTRPETLSSKAAIKVPPLQPAATFEA